MIPPRDFNALFRHGESRLGSNDAAMAYCVIRGARVKEAIECIHSETLSVPLYRSSIALQWPIGPSQMSRMSFVHWEDQR